MGDIYEQEVRSRRTPALQQFLDAFVESTGIEQDFVDSCEHPYGCHCEKCLHWWARMGPEDPEEDGEFIGPFRREDVEMYCEEKGLPVWWKA